MTARLATPADFDAVLALNAESEHFLSPLTAARLARLHDQSERHWAIEAAGHVVGFAMVFREGTDYDSVNYRWFAARYPRFLYVDRIVVAAGHQGRGIGAQLYRLVFDHAAASGVPWVAAEYDVLPPNAASANFHARLGFREVGRQSVADGRKTVTLQLAPVDEESDYAGG
jgi:hypothetical protein